MEKLCIDCRHVRLPPNWDRMEAREREDAAMCSRSSDPWVSRVTGLQVWEMNKACYERTVMGDCGPDAARFEARDCRSDGRSLE